MDSARTEAIGPTYAPHNFPLSMNLFIPPVACLIVWAWAMLPLAAAEPIPVWPDLAPGETSREVGEALPARDGETPPITRIVNIRRPTLEVFPAEQPNGTGVLILPGGGFGRVVTDLEGSEAARFLNPLGISVFVLRYRTNEGKPEDEANWLRPLQDGQRSLRLLRTRAAEWKLQPDRIGVLGFSAGGQVAAVLHTAEGVAAYAPMDDVDQHSCQPDFSLLIYPWRVTEEGSGELLSAIRVSEKSPPVFIVHTHDDASSAVGAALIYIEHKRKGVPAELHIYETGGHGYGTRVRPDSVIHTWTERATDWLKLHDWARR